MHREVRRFNVWDDVGRMFILVESANYAVDDAGCEVRIGPSTFETLTGEEAVLGNVNGFYRIPSCGVIVSELNDAP